jgi:hypothetical protein
MCSEESIKEQQQKIFYTWCVWSLHRTGAHSLGDLFLLQHHPRIILFRTLRSDIYLLEQSGLNAVKMGHSGLGEKADLALPQQQDNSILPF